MNETHILDLYRSRLAKQILEQDTNSPSINLLNVSPWLAMSLLQKAIRRGRDDLALRAAKTLLSDSPDRLWRRLGVTAFEDIGVADYETVSLVMAGLTGKRYRAKLGGEWAVASYLISIMCAAVKCRATDDLGVVCDWHPDFEQSRLDMTFKPIPELLKIASGKGAIPARALATWYAIGTDRCRSPILRERRGEPQAVFDHFCDAGFPDTVVEVARVGFRKTGCLLAPFTVLLWREAQRSARYAEPDDFPDEAMIGEVPGWAFDVHVREGNVAMNRFLKMDCETTRWINENWPQNGRTKFLGNLIYRVESGLVLNRLRWKTGDDLRRMSEFECPAFRHERVAEAMELLRTDMPLLNEARRMVVAGAGK